MQYWEQNLNPIRNQHKKQLKREKRRKGLDLQKSNSSADIHIAAKRLKFTLFKTSLA